MKIDKAEVQHIDEIMQVIDDARIIMRQTGNHTQWTNGYPSKYIILQDIEKNAGYICHHENEIVGYFSFLKGDNPEPVYDKIESGKWINHAPYGVIHRLASNGKVKGVAKFCFDFCFTLINNIKIDTHHNNVPMQNFLKRYGFVYCGIVYLPDGSARDAFQMTM